MLNFLDYIVDNNINIYNKLIYVVINCGFREGEQNITALNIVKRWCEKVEANYKKENSISRSDFIEKAVEF